MPGSSLGKRPTAMTVMARSLARQIYPFREDIELALRDFQGEVSQTPPMFSAKKVNGQKLYNLARKGIVVERKPVTVHMQIQLLHYEYPYADLRVACSKGTYVRSIAHDLGQQLGCGAHLVELERLRSGKFTLSQSVCGDEINNPDVDIAGRLQQVTTL